VVWLVLSVIGVLLVIFALGPHMPPGSAGAQAHEQHKANIIISAILTPIAIGLLVYFAYALTVFRQRGAERSSRSLTPLGTRSLTPLASRG
jgi:heme/copper-type cytochrome/quinol oxidase subunit 2